MALLVLNCTSLVHAEPQRAADRAGELQAAESIALSESHLKSGRLEAGSILHFEFPDLPPTLYEMAKKEKLVPAFSARLPDNFSLDRKFPLFVYCFEQNSLLAAALRQLGFRVTPLLARARWQVPASIITGLIHLLLHVETEVGPCIADVGFGSMSLHRPLRLEFDREQLGCLEAHRFIKHGPRVVQQALIGNTWTDVYNFTLDPAPWFDCELANWFAGTHPASQFRRMLRWHGSRRIAG